MSIVQLREDSVLKKVVILVLQVPLHRSTLLDRWLVVVERTVGHKRLPLFSLLRVIALDLESLEHEWWVGDIVVWVHSL